METKCVSDTYLWVYIHIQYICTHTMGVTNHPKRFHPYLNLLPPKTNISPWKMLLERRFFLFDMVPIVRWDSFSFGGVLEIHPSKFWVPSIWIWDSYWPLRIKCLRVNVGCFRPWCNGVWVLTKGKVQRAVGFSTLCKGWMDDGCFLKRIYEGCITWVGSTKFWELHSLKPKVRTWQEAPEGNSSSNPLCLKCQLLVSGWVSG